MKSFLLKNKKNRLSFRLYRHTFIHKKECFIIIVSSLVICNNSKSRIMYIHNSVYEKSMLKLYDIHAINKMINFMNHCNHMHV
jgi:hypothetical protein